VTSTRLILAAGTVAASLAGIVPVAHSSGTPGGARPAVTVRTDGIAVSADSLRGHLAATVSVPAGVTRLDGVPSGSPALAERVRVRIVRQSDGATLFVGTLATFKSLPVAAGDRLRVGFTRMPGAHRLRASARLSWA
jgi:hypothetical protein